MQRALRGTGALNMRGMVSHPNTYPYWDFFFEAIFDTSCILRKSTQAEQFLQYVEHKKALNSNHRKKYKAKIFQSKINLL